MTAANAIRVERLIVEHATNDGAIRALDGVDISVVGGSSVAVMGPSGCGKSTLLGVLAGLALPTSGRVWIGETELTALSEPARATYRRSHIGVVYQADNLLPFLTIAENVLLQLALGTNGSGPADASERTRRVGVLLTRLGLEGFEDRLPDELSGGQRQRVAVARAVVHEPSLILADEPTGALDSANACGVVDLLTGLHRELGATLIMVTHDPATALGMQRSIALRDGTVFDEGVDRHAR